MPELKPRVSKVGGGAGSASLRAVEVSVFLIVFLRRARGLSCMFTQFHANCTQPENAKQHSTGDGDYL